MSRRKRPAEHANHERWLVSYADFITLLFAFFVVLYASSQVDKKKMAQVAAAISGGFREMGVFSGNNNVVVMGQGPNAGISKAQVAQLQKSISAKAENGSNRPGTVDVANLKRELEQVLGAELKRNEVKMHIGPDGLVVSLREVGFFNSGDSTLLPGAEQKLTRVATVLGSKGYEIRIEGHTDNVPIHSARFRSNWELSTARATEVVSLLVEKYHFDPQKVAIAGYSEYRPVESNATEEGRRTNRRVDLVIVTKH